MDEKDNKRELREENRKRRQECKQIRINNRQNEKLKKSESKEAYKIKKLENAENFEKEREAVNHGAKHFRCYNFFTKWFYLGVIMVLISVCLSLYQATIVNGNVILTTLTPIASGVCSSLGVALFVGCIFDFSKNSEAFVGFVSKILKDIIISKNFLTSLAANDKKEALKLILQPSNKQLEKYSNINEYFKKKIDDYMKMFEDNFKTNLTLNIEVKKEDGIVKSYSVLTYTVYKVGEKFLPIKVSFEKAGSKSDDVTIIYENGEMKINPKDLYEHPEANGCLMQTTIECDVPEELQKYDKITIRRKMIEPGYDHWINYDWQSLTPYEGINCTVRCLDNLTVKDYLIYDNKAFYHAEISDDRTSLHIYSSQWLEADTGFYITISDS